MTNNPISKDEMVRLYVTERLTMSEIARRTGVHEETIRKMIHKFGIKARKVGPIPKVLISKIELENAYVKRRLSMKTIARMLGFGETVIHKLLHRHGISIRPRSVSLRGRVRSLSHRMSISQNKIGKMRGPENPNWKGGIGHANYLFRHTAEYVTFRRAVLRVKGDKCADCGADLLTPCPTCERPFDRHVHHVKPFSLHPELRTMIENAIVLCESCHRRSHKPDRHS